ncbi:hypothetical protein AcV7_008646 [Taiwanofungus camphoratus]|nr:hypothetical protein AcV7_008646 [Antrodia cinnamomea]
MTQTVFTLLHYPDAAVSALARPLARTLNLPQLPPHFPALVYSFLACTALHLVVSPALSPRLFPASYAKLRTKRQVNNWNIQVVSLLHVFLVVPLAARCLASEALSQDKAFGWDDRVGTTVAVACGYFLWDVVDGIVNFDDVGFLIHGVSCLTVYVMTFRPFVGYYACRFLSWELSTIFLNIHRFLDKTGHTGSIAQLLNGVLLLGTFVGVRIAWGWYATAGLWRTVYQARGEVPAGYVVVYLVGSAALNCLNAIWLYKMVHALRRRFNGDVKSVGTVASSHDHANYNGKMNGHTNGKLNGKAE